MTLSHYRNLGQPAAPAPLGRRLQSLAAPWVHGRRGLILGGAVLLAGGLALGWGWLAAAGIAPVILSLLPCAAMCALGICMMPRGKASCATASPAVPKSEPDSAPDSAHAPEA
jgi:hypothetical protein